MIETPCFVFLLSYKTIVAWPPHVVNPFLEKSFLDLGVDFCLRYLYNELRELGTRLPKPREKQKNESAFTRL